MIWQLRKLKKKEVHKRIYIFFFFKHSTQFVPLYLSIGYLYLFEKRGILFHVCFFFLFFYFLLRSLCCLSLVFLDLNHNEDMLVTVTIKRRKTFDNNPP